MRKIVCSKDGCLLALAAEDLTLTVYRITLDQNLNLLAASPLITDTCAKARFAGIALFGTEDGILWQRPDKTVMHCDAKSAGMREFLQASEQLCGRFEGGSFWKSTGGHKISLDAGNVQIPVSARVNDAVLHEGTLYAALENRTVTCFDPADGEKIREYALSSESPGCLAVCEDVIYGLDRYGALFRIQNDSLEELGRIMQGDNLLDTDGRLLGLGEGRIAFVSMQRRALLSASSCKAKPSLVRVSEGKSGLSCLFHQGKHFTAVLSSGTEMTEPYPAILLTGRNVNETNNLKAACSDHALAYEENGIGIHYVNAAGRQLLRAPDLSEMGGWLSDLRYVRETDTFRAVSFHSEYLETDEHGTCLVQKELPGSESNLTLLCPCGTRSAVLSRRVRIREDPSRSAYYADVLSVIEGDRILFQKEISRADAQITGFLYDEAEHVLAVCYSTKDIELFRPETGEPAGKGECVPVSFLQGAAMHAGLIYTLASEEDDRRLTVCSLQGKTICSLPSGERVSAVIETKDGVLVQEGNDRLYRVMAETGE